MRRLHNALVKIQMRGTACLRVDPVNATGSLTPETEASL